MVFLSFWYFLGRRGRWVGIYRRLIMISYGSSKVRSVSKKVFVSCLSSKGFTPRTVRIIINEPKTNNRVNSPTLPLFHFLLVYKHLLLFHQKASPNSTNPSQTRQDQTGRGLGRGWRWGKGSWISALLYRTENNGGEEGRGLLEEKSWIANTVGRGVRRGPYVRSGTRTEGFWVFTNTIHTSSRICRMEVRRENTSMINLFLIFLIN